MPVQNHSEETKRKISESLKGKKKSKIHVENISKALTGRVLSEKTKNRMKRSKAKMTQETKDKMSKAKTGVNHPLYGIKGANHPNYGKTYTRPSKMIRTK